jgi:hypothetical protein
MQGALQLL